MTIALVTGTNVGATGGSTATTSAVDTTGATLLVAATTYFTGRTTVTVTDNKGNTWTGRTEYASGTSCLGKIFYCENPTVGSGHTVTLTDSGGSLFGSIDIAGFSGTLTASSYDVENGAGTTSGTTKQPGSVTPGEANELVVTTVGAGNAKTFTIDSSFSIASQNSGGGSNFSNGLAYIVQSPGPSAVNPTWTVSGGAGQIVAAIATFKAAAGAASIVPLYMHRVQQQAG